MAFDSTARRNLANPKNRSIWQRVPQPPPFKATGRGFANKLPWFPAGPSNANASLVNQASPHPRLQKMYLFVTAVQTGFTLAGETTQTQASRSFYPRNLQQNELTIEGTVANQYEYDRLVEFILHHHHTQFLNTNVQAPTLDDVNNYPGVIFHLIKPKNSAIMTHPPMRYQVVITDIQAGAQQFQMVGLPFQLTCKVTYDYLQKRVEIEKELTSRVRIKDVFGASDNPVPARSLDLLDTIINGTNESVNTATITAQNPTAARTARESF